MAFDPISSAILIAVITAGASYIQAKKAQKKAKEMTEGVESNIESNSKEIPVVYGERRVGGVRVYIDTSRDKKHKYLYMVLAMAEGEVESITDIKIDDIPITDARFITSGNKQNLWYETYTGTDTQNVSTLIKDGVKYNTTEDVWNDPWNSQHDRDSQLPDVTYPWGDNHRLQGVAYLALKFKWDEKAYNGVPDVTAVVKGRKVYDPRTQTTGWSNNPALCIRDYLTNPRYGKGLPESAIDDVAFGQAATDCENFTVTPYTGSLDTHQLFTMDHVVDTSKKILENLNDMLLSCRAFLPYSKGVYSLKIDQPSASVLSIGADQIISGIAIAGNKKEDRFNQVKVNFFNKGLEYKEDQAIYPETNSTLYQAYLAEDDNEPLIEEVDIFSLNNFYSAREMARLILERSRQNSTISFNGTSELINLEVGEVVSITHPTPAWNNKLFQVQEVALNFDGTVNVTCIEYDAALYTYDTPDEEQPFIGSRLPDPNQVDPITSLSVSTGSYIENDGKTIGYVDASWTAPEDELVDRYEIKFEYNSREDVIEVASSQYRFKPTQDNTDYTVSVRAVNGLGIRSDWVTHTAVTSVIDTTPPALPTGITATGGIKHITLDWTNPTDDDFDVVEIKANTTDSESTATLIATVKVDNFIHDIGTNNATRYYYLRSKDRTGNGSEWTTAVSATTVKVESGDLDVNELSDISTDLGSITGGSLNIGSGTFTVDSSGNMVATSATIEGQGTFGDGIVASSESGTLEVGRAISDGTVKVGSQLGYYSSNGGYTHESFIEFRLTDMRIFMGEGTGNFKFEGGNNTGYDFERPVTFTTTPTVDGTNVALITDIVGNTDNYADSFSINNTTGVMTIGRTGSLGDLTADISTYVGNQVSALVDSAPSTLDTLNELASALGDDPNFATTVTNSIATKANKSGDTFTGDVTFNNHVKLPQNPTGTTYGNTISTIPTAMITQRVGDNDGWRLYGEAPVTNDVKMIFEIVDDIETGDTWVFRNKKTYGDYSATEPFKIQGNGNIIATGTITASGYNNSNWDTAYTYSQVGHLPLTGGTVNGNLTLNSISDAQLFLNSNGSTWAGIAWTDSGGTDYMFFNGATKTFAIGGGGSSGVSGKKLHIDGGVTIGSTYDNTTMPSDGIRISGTTQTDGGISSVGSVHLFNNASDNHLGLFSNNGARQRADSRDESSFARTHWYGVSDTGATSNFRHAWYDGNSYVNITAENDGVTFGGHLTATNIHVNGDLKMSGSDSYIWTPNTSTGFTGIWDAHNSRSVLRYDNNLDSIYLQRFTNIGNVASTNDGNWNARLNITGSSHARLDVFNDADDIRMSMYSHVGNGNGRVGTLSNHPLGLMVNGTVHADLKSNGRLNTSSGYEVGGTTVMDSSRNISGQRLTLFGGSSNVFDGTDGISIGGANPAIGFASSASGRNNYLLYSTSGGGGGGSLRIYESNSNTDVWQIRGSNTDNNYTMVMGGATSTWGASNRATLVIGGVSTTSLLEFRNQNTHRGYIYSFGTTLETLSYGNIDFLPNASSSYRVRVNSSGVDSKIGYLVDGTTVIDLSRNASFVNGSFVGNLDVITGGSSGQLRVGRTSDQNLLINVSDRTALIEHRQDEGSGEHVMRFNINSPTALASKSFDFTNGNIRVSGTTVIDSSRNISGVNLSLSGQATIWTNSDNALVLRQGQSGHPWNYIEFRNSTNDRNWYTGTDPSGNYVIQGETGATGVYTNKRLTAEALTSKAKTYIDSDHGSTRLQLKYRHNGVEEDGNSGHLTLWTSEPGITYDNCGIGGNVNVSGQHYGRQINANPYGVYLRFDVNSGFSEFWSTTGNAGTAGGQGSRRWYVDASGNTTQTGNVTIDKNTPRLDLKSDQSGSNVGGRLELNENGNLWLNAQGGKDLWLNWLAPNSASSKSDLNVGDGNSGSYILQVSGSSRAVNVSGNITVVGSLYFNNTATRLYEGSGNSLKVQTSSGYVEVGSQNSGWCHFQTDRASFYFNKKVTVDSGIIESYNEDLILRRASSSSHQMTLNTSGATFTGNVTAYSDARLKDNVKTLDGSKVYQMRGVSFTKDGEAGSGVIAQELEKVAPELVMTNNDEMQTKSVAYGNVVGYLIEAIKELKSEIEELKNGANSN